ncbi:MULTISPECIES: DUF6802 family protein [Nocardia]|uniref:DUF6802 domain-containing protein n=2 Tax=Nocardia TaxID=1817 RepID=A0A846YD36_9NOCA|nr:MULTISPECIES: DUF6802 family protein [Nocardia]NKY55654.1 hypothetical protein [Nocardia flavorosea]
MPVSGEFPGLGMPSFDATSSLDSLGPVEMESPTQDLDGDGILDTFTTTNSDSMSVWTDSDLDGYADQLSVVENDGDYAAWEYHRNPDGTGEWRQTDQGTVGE